MKKNEAKTGKARTVDTRSSKEQMEDRTFNRMLLWLAATVVVEALMLLVNRFYVHIHVDELALQPAIHTILGIAPIVGILLCVGCLFWASKLHKAGKDVTLQIVLAVACLVAGVGAFLMRMYGVAGAPMVLGVVPALGVLMLVFYLYQKEFFGCAFVGALGILGLWLFRSVNDTTIYYIYLAVALVIMVVGVFLALKLKKDDGLMTIKGKEIAVLQSDAAYLTYYLTAVISAVLMLAPLALGAAVAYYAIWVMAAWLFILAVYFTSKLM